MYVCTVHTLRPRWLYFLHSRLWQLLLTAVILCSIFAGRSYFAIDLLLFILLPSYLFSIFGNFEKGVEPLSCQCI
ncbi:hypothetical protein BDV29DRAFT_165082 [Aspergillus leporis]|uniref:Sema domain-containing protein n=1 Tax=Aspergillus leporis TaxID=41062 RepID=A0A5N5XID5_9EURO|nr:hypothetical protein BDV29DRAFT_165082 [Aspergillus leporis]